MTPTAKPVDFNRATEVTEEVDKIVEDLFTYHPWGPDQTQHGNAVRDALAKAVRVIIRHVPPSPDRTVAIRKLRECRMDCNSALTFNGRY